MIGIGYVYVSTDLLASFLANTVSMYVCHLFFLPNGKLQSDNIVKLICNIYNSKE